jgi:hypothetical protein
MPKRSNPFQQVVALLHKQYVGATVSESKFLADSRTGDLREVDVVIDSDVAGYRLVTSIECLDHHRKATVEWVERMYGKHTDLPTNKLVLISRSGFTKGAKIKAASRGITLVALDQVAEFDWTSIVGKKSRVELEAVQTQYQAFIVVESPNDQRVLSPPRDLTLHGETTTAFAVLGELLDRIVAMPEIGGLILDRLQNTEMTSAPFTVEFEFPDLMAFKGPEGDTLRTRRLRIAMTSQREMIGVPLVHGSLRGTSVAFGETKAASLPTRFAILEEPDNGPVVEVTRLQEGQWKAIVNADSRTPGIQLERPDTEPRTGAGR